MLMDSTAVKKCNGPCKGRVYSSLAWNLNNQHSLQSAEAELYSSLYTSTYTYFSIIILYIIRLGTMVYRALTRHCTYLIYLYS